MRLGREARVYWPKNDNMPAAFGDLFVNPVEVGELPDDAITHRSWRFSILPEDELHLPEGFAVVGASTHPMIRAIGKSLWRMRGRPDDRYRYMMFPKSHSKRSTRADRRHIDFEYGRIPEYFRRVYGELFRRIEYRPEIQAAVDEWASKNIDSSVIGVQIRTWRDHSKRYRKYHLPSMDRLRRLLGEAPGGARFLVVSDSDEPISTFAAELGADRLLQYPRTTGRSASWQSVAGIQEDLIDMLLLARTETMFASYLSTFSETAWWLGGARAEVEVF
jgi:hypothetical protein